MGKLSEIEARDAKFKLDGFVLHDRRYLLGLVREYRRLVMAVVQDNSVVNTIDWRALLDRLEE